MTDADAEEAQKVSEQQEEEGSSQNFELHPDAMARTALLFATLERDDE